MPFLATAWRWFLNNPIAQFIVAFVLVAIGWNVVRRNIQETGRIQERERIAAAQAKVKVAVQERSITIINEERTHAQDAIEARDSSPLYPTFDELPDAHKRILDRSRGSGEAS